MGGQEWGGGSEHARGRRRGREWKVGKIGEREMGEGRGNEESHE